MEKNESDPAKTAAVAAIKRTPRKRFAPRPADDGIPTEEWMLSYSDMVTLLLTLFVALLIAADYGNSTGGTGGAGGVRGTGGAGGPEAAGGTGSEHSRGIRGVLEELLQMRAISPYAEAEGFTAVAVSDAKPTTPDQQTAVIKTEDLARIERRQAVLKDIREKLTARQLSDFITADVDGDGIRMTIPNSILFDPGAAELKDRGPAVLRALTPVIESGDFAISVEGHTDNVPINTERYPSNWELSAQRAAVVVRALNDAGIAAQRLQAVGYSDTRPLTGNDTEDGRRENRRVSIFLRL